MVEIEGKEAWESMYEFVADAGVFCGVGAPAARSFKRLFLIGSAMVLILEKMGAGRTESA